MQNKVSLVELRFGRNVRGVPMSAGDWARFQQMARAVLDGVADGLQAETVAKLKQWTEVHTGRGEWTNEDGTVEHEESAVVTLFTEGDTDGLIGVLEFFAGELADEFQQDAVAAIVSGATVLATAESSLR